MKNRTLLSSGMSLGPWRAAAMALLIAMAIGLVVRTKQIERRAQAPLPVAEALRYDPALASMAIPGEAQIDIEGADVPRPLELGRRQTLGDLLGHLGLDSSETRGVVTALDGHLDVRKIRPGPIGVAYFDAGSTLSGLRFDLRGKGWVELERSPSAWSSTVHEFVRQAEVRRIEGELEDFLEASVRRAGGRPQVAYAMSSVLQWDLDFNRDLRLGDRFQLVYEEVYLDGEYAGLGEVLALVYENRARRFEAFRYGPHGYFDGDGRPLQKMFLRSPLPFTRVTSRFTSRRFHPILKVNRPHWGVDFGAPRGTPVRVTASGVVSFAGRSGGAGNMIKVRHANGYETAYLHLSGYAKGVRRGRQVLQGDVIGYVGSTGLSTGPHLDYRVKRNGRWLDPLQLKNDPVEPIPAAEMPDFRDRCDALRRALEGGELPPPIPPLPPVSAQLAQRRQDPALGR
ncbi:MAG: M23 family metallopeptidase [Acidobacteriota bacterium]